jgi:flagellar protein FlgJ
MTTLNPNLNRYKEAGKAEAAPLPADASSDPSDPAFRARATTAALKFESYFIGSLLHKMRSATAALADPASPFKNPVNNDMLDMTDNLVADQLASQRSFGIANAILRQLLPPAAAPPAHPMSATEQSAAPPLNKPT